MSQANAIDVTMPVIAIVDTCFLRTGLQRQLESGMPPASLTSMRSGSVRAFMEGETLSEAIEKVPEFAAQLNVPERKLKKLMINEWLPSIRVIDLPPHLLELDERGAAVRDRDADDYPTAALAGLLSPCVLLTHDFRDFEPLGIRDYTQAVFTIFMIDDVKASDVGLQVSALLPASPFLALGGGTKWAYDRYGPIALGVAGLAIAGGFALYLKQPREKREAFAKVAGKVGIALLEMYAEALAESQRAREALRKNVVPPPESPLPVASILRELATSTSSLSAQQLHDILEPTFVFNVKEVRDYLHGYKDSLFFEERRGGFLLGVPYQVWREKSPRALRAH